MDHAGDDFAIRFEADEDGPERIAAHEVAGAVDGIDNPAAAGARFLERALFAEDAVAGKCAGEDGGDEALAFAIGDGDGGMVGLRFGANTGGLMAQGELGGAGGGGSRDIDFSGVGHVSIVPESP